MLPSSLVFGIGSTTPREAGLALCGRIVTYPINLLTNHGQATPRPTEHGLLACISPIAKTSNFCSLRHICFLPLVHIGNSVGDHPLSREDYNVTPYAEQLDRQPLPEPNVFAFSNVDACGFFRLVPAGRSLFFFFLHSRTTIPGTLCCPCFLVQVKYLGLLENVKVRRAGFAYRQYYDKFLKRFKYVCHATFPRPFPGSDKAACQAIVESIPQLQGVELCDPPCENPGIVAGAYVLPS